MKYVLEIDDPNISMYFEKQLQIRAKSFENSINEHIFGKVARPYLATLPKNKLHYRYVSIFISRFWEYLFEKRSQMSK